MRNHLQKLHDYISGKYPRVKFAVGILLVLVGLLALVTPLTPGSWLALVGLELVGIRVLTGKWLGKIFKAKDSERRVEDSNL
ncbi:MAG: hypothetical protein HYW65_03745 [Candidatus Liptonbacteria bacterium]|nr:hypothetical protein [Candidatus Liptonbacteria bacterium]